MSYDFITNNEIFTLFESETQLYDTYKNIKHKIFPKGTTNKSLFKLYTETLSQFEEPSYYPAIIHKLTYCDYILKQYFTSSSICLSNADELLDHFTNHVSYLDASPSEFISYSYTTNYLKNCSSYLLYSHYMKYISENKNSKDKLFKKFIIDNSYPISKYNYYKLNTNLQSLKNTSNITRKISAIDTYILKPLINYHHGTEKGKNNSYYYINTFLPDLTATLIDATSKFNTDNFTTELENLYSETIINSKLKLLINTYFDIATNFCNTENSITNIHSLYKLEYGFGCFSMIYHIRKLLYTTEPFDKKSIQNIDISDFFNKISTIQRIPDIYSIRRFNLSDTDIELDFELSINKIKLSILLDLYNNELDTLEHDLSNYITSQKPNINFSNLSILSIRQDTLLNNGWGIMQYMLNYLSPENNNNRSKDIAIIENFVKSLSYCQKKTLAGYLINRYSNNWFNEIKTPFSNNAINTLNLRDIREI